MPNLRRKYPKVCLGENKIKITPVSPPMPSKALLVRFLDILEIIMTSNDIDRGTRVILYFSDTKKLH